MRFQFRDAAFVLLERFLLRELVCPSANVEVGRAVVGALATLGIGSGPTVFGPGDECWQRARERLLSLAQHKNIDAGLRDAAATAVVGLELAGIGRGATIGLVLKRLGEPVPGTIWNNQQWPQGALRAMLSALLASPVVEGEDGDNNLAALVPAIRTAARDAKSPWVRHALWMLGRRCLGGGVAVLDEKRTEMAIVTGECDMGRGCDWWKSWSICYGGG